MILGDLQSLVKDHLSDNLLKEKHNINSAKTTILEKDLIKAMANKEFELYYQPIVTLNSGKITGFE